MHKIYVAGPYSGNTLETLKNMRVGIRKCLDLLLKGYAPFCPWLDYQYALMLREGEELKVEDFYAYSLAWMEASDAVLLLPGWENSKGTLLEIARAEEISLPVFYPHEEEAMFEYLNTLKDACSFSVGKKNANPVSE